MQHDGAFRDGRRSGADVARIPSDPITRCTSAFFNPGLILADGYREPAVSGASLQIAHETFNRPHDRFRFCFVFLENVKQLFRTFAGIVSDNCMHDIPPDIHQTNERLEGYQTAVVVVDATAVSGQAAHEVEGGGLPLT
jgi:hypothetical protein